MTMLQRLIRIEHSNYRLHQSRHPIRKSLEQSSIRLIFLLMSVINLCHICKSFLLIAAKSAEINFEDNEEFDNFSRLSSICQYFGKMCSHFEANFRLNYSIHPSSIPLAPLDSLLKLDLFAMNEITTLPFEQTLAYAYPPHSWEAIIQLPVFLFISSRVGSMISA